mmetsp:Transcript_6508/g.11335  ORF Transcript_6508/g.11335 Transcript_6508/m.11335 type:complete len:114 (+) Transcript_6508:597-938(+)
MLSAALVATVSSMLLWNNLWCTVLIARLFLLGRRVYSDVEKNGTYPGAEKILPKNQWKILMFFGIIIINNNNNNNSSSSSNRTKPPTGLCFCLQQCLVTEISQAQKVSVKRQR